MSMASASSTVAGKHTASRFGEFQQQMNALRQAYIEELPARTQQIEALWTAACEGTCTQEDLYTLYRAVHQLSGSGETFGLAEITEATRYLEKLVMNLIVHEVLPSIEDQAKALVALSVLKLAALEGPSCPLASTLVEPFLTETLVVPEEAEGAHTQNTILIVEDGAFLRTKIAVSLRAVGYRVCEGDNGLSALDMAREHHPDLILMDVVMPTMDGLEATRLIRQDEALCDIPIIIMTSQNTIKDLQRALICEIDDYIIKPFRQDQLIKRVQACLVNV